jgi:glycosyltransferase involved in cell wall biosynthesis
MSDEPKVSVVIATYNYAHYIAGAIRSALDQILADIEVVVVDDGSTDDTEDVMRPFLGDPRVRYVKTENRGQPAAENTGIVSSRAPLIAFLDADDLWLPAKLEKQVALFERDPDLGIAYSRRLLMDQDGHELEYGQPTLYRGWITEQMFLRNFVCFSSSVVARRVFDAVGLFDERRRQASDYDLWLRASREFRFDFVDEPLVLYREGHASLKKQGGTQLVSALGIMDEFLARYEGRAGLAPGLIRRAYSETYTNLGYAVRPSSRLRALSLFVRSIALRPAYIEPWLAIIGTLPFPEASRRVIRRMLGRPVDYRRRRIGESAGRARGAPAAAGVVR